MNASPNTVIAKRICKECGGMSVAHWYTKRGRYNVFCMKCGKTWNLRSEKNG